MAATPQTGAHGGCGCGDGGGGSTGSGDGGGTAGGGRGEGAWSQLEAQLAEALQQAAASRAGVLAIEESGAGLLHDFESFVRQLAAAATGVSEGGEPPPSLARSAMDSSGMCSSPTTSGSGEGDEGRPAPRVGEVLEIFTGLGRGCAAARLGEPDATSPSVRPMRSMSESSV